MHLLNLQPATSQPATYSIDHERSTIQFTATHMGFLEVSGTFRSFRGSIRFNRKDTLASTAECLIPVDSIDTENRLRDRSLRSESFLNSKKFPEISVTTNDWQRGENHFKADTKISIMGITQSIPLKFKVEKCGMPDRVVDGCTRVTGTFIFSRQRFKLEFDSAMDGLIGDDIRVDFTIVAVQNHP